MNIPMKRGYIGFQTKSFVWFTLKYPHPSNHHSTPLDDSI